MFTSTWRTIRRALLLGTGLLGRSGLNGLAFDHLAEHTNRVTNEEKSILSDWDFDNLITGLLRKLIDSPVDGSPRDANNLRISLPASPLSTTIETAHT